MTTTITACWAGLTLVAGLSLADPPRPAGPNAGVRERASLLQPLFRYRNVAAVEPVSPATADPAIVQMDPVQVRGEPFPVLSGVADANAQETSMQACALVTRNLPDHQQIDFFVAPIQLGGHQAGFPLEMYRF